MVIWHVMACNAYEQMYGVHLNLLFAFQTSKIQLHLTFHPMNGHWMDRTESNHGFTIKSMNNWPIRGKIKAEKKTHTTAKNQESQRRKRGNIMIEREWNKLICGLWIDRMLFDESRVSHHQHNCCCCFFLMIWLFCILFFVSTFRRTSKKSTFLLCANYPSCSVPWSSCVHR